MPPAIHFCALSVAQTMVRCFWSVPAFDQVKIECLMPVIPPEIEFEPQCNSSTSTLQLLETRWVPPFSRQVTKIVALMKALTFFYVMTLLQLQSPPNTTGDQSCLMRGLKTYKGIYHQTNRVYKSI